MAVIPTERFPVKPTNYLRNIISVNDGPTAGLEEATESKSRTNVPNQNMNYKNPTLEMFVSPRGALRIDQSHHTRAELLYHGLGQFLDIFHGREDVPSLSPATRQA